MNNALDVHPKVVGGGIGSGAAVLVIWLLGLAHVVVDPVVAGALVASLSAVGAWLSPILNAERQKILASYSTATSSGASGTGGIVTSTVKPAPKKPSAAKP